MDKQFFDQKSHTFLIGTLILLGYVFCMFGNGMVSLTHPDEVFYIQSAKEMVEYNKWFTPMIFDGVQFEKPFVAFTLFAAAIKWFGLNSGAARFWPALFGMIGIVVAYWISWTLFARKRLAFLSGMILCTSFIYVALSRAVLTDMIFTNILAIAIGFFLLAYYNPKYKTAGLIWAWVFTAIGVLTKGALGLSFFTTTVWLFLWYRKDFKFLLCPANYIGIGLFLLIATPWHVIMYQHHGQWFIDEYWTNVHVRRLFEAEHKRLDNWYFYPGLIFGGIMPWSFFWFPAASAAFDQFKQKIKGREKIFFLLGWMAAVLLYTQPAVSKLASYIFPLFPAVAILVAWYIDQAIEKADRGEKQTGLKMCAYSMATVMIVGGIVGPIIAHQYLDIIVSAVPAYVAACFLFVTAGSIIVFNRQAKYGRMILSYIGMTTTLLILLLAARPYIEPWVSCKDISDVFKKIDQSDTPVLASKFYVRGVRYYTDRPMAVIDINGKGFWSPHPIPFLNTDQMVVDFFNERPVTYAVVKEGNVKDIFRILKGRPFTIEELDGIGGKFILRVTKIQNFAKLAPTLP